MVQQISAFEREIRHSPIFVLTPVDACLPGAPERSRAHRRGPQRTADAELTKQSHERFHRAAHASGLPMSDRKIRAGGMRVRADLKKANPPRQPNRVRLNTCEIYERSLRDPTRLGGRAVTSQNIFPKNLSSLANSPI
jgi:hypothetical protein